MRTPLFALVAGTAMLAAPPCLALTISSAPPRPDVAQRLKPADGAGFGLDGAWAKSARPAEQPGFSGGVTFESTQTFGFGGVTTTIRRGPDADFRQDPRWTGERRETPAPLSLSPPRR
jgi:hypothetical protein